MRRKVLAFVLCVCLGLGAFGIDAKAIEGNLGDPLKGLDEEDESAAVMEMANDVPYSGLYATETLLVNESKAKVAVVDIYNIETKGEIGNHYVSAGRSFYSSVPDIISFFDNKGYYNVVKDSERESKVYIQRYDSNMKLVSNLQIAYKYSIFGNIICDNDGYYYIIWGQNDTNVTNCVTMSVAKYDYNGNYIAECTFSGYDTKPVGSNVTNEWGTKYPFDAGNCSVAINNGVLACNYAREMYSGHQSNYVIYVNCSTMTRVDSGSPYCSHSFDQRIISLSNGGFLVANQGDAYPRSFRISLVTGSTYQNIDNFHFREGADRDHGYNETYAQLGGIAETANAYVFCASSERTLSIQTAPTNTSYCGHSEARNLFIQILKKNFYNYSGGNQYYVKGATRTATGTKPSSANTELWLNGNEIDYGIIWLTDYDDSYYVNNPKVVVTSNNKIVVMWEKLRYDTHEGDCYYAILNEDGTIYQDALQIVGATLAGNIDPVYKDGKIYWTAEDGTTTRIYCLNPSLMAVADNYVGLRKVGDKWIYVNHGVQDTSKNGLVPFEGNWFYVQKGELNTSMQGFVDYDGGSFYVADGRVCSEYSGLVLDGSSWKFIAEGQFQKQYTGLALYDGEWFLLSNGVLRTTYNGLYSYNGRQFLVADGQILSSYSGLFENTNGCWYFIIDGQVSDYTGLVLYDNEWFYIENGQLATWYTGYVKYDGSSFYVINGQVYT